MVSCASPPLVSFSRSFLLPRDCEFWSEKKGSIFVQDREDGSVDDMEAGSVTGALCHARECRQHQCLAGAAGSVFGQHIPRVQINCRSESLQLIGKMILLLVDNETISRCTTQKAMGYSGGGPVVLRRLKLSETYCLHGGSMRSPSRSSSIWAPMAPESYRLWSIVVRLLYAESRMLS